MPYSDSAPPDYSNSSERISSELARSNSFILELDSAKEYLTAPKSLMLLGGWMTLGLMALSLVGCWLTPYNTKVKVPALVRYGTSQNKNNSLSTIETAAFVAETWVPNRSINAIELGQPVQIRLNSCPYPNYGALEGRVSKIATDTASGAGRLTDLVVFENLNRSTQINSYKVLIQLETSRLEAAGQKSCQLRAGMEGRADIGLGQERLLSFLMRKVRL